MRQSYKVVRTVRALGSPPSPAVAGEGGVGSLMRKRLKVALTPSLSHCVGEGELVR